MRTLIAEDLLLLLLDDESGRYTGAHHQAALAGAVLAELATDGAVELDESGRFWRRTTVGLTGSVAADPVLREVAERIGERPRSPQDLVNRLGGRVEEAVRDRLVERGVLRRDERRVLGLFPRPVWPAADSTHEEHIRAQMGAVLFDGREPDPRTATLIALLVASGSLSRVVSRDGSSSRELKKRAKQVAAGSWASEAVSRAIADAQSAVATSAAAATAATNAAVISST